MNMNLKKKAHNMNGLEKLKLTPEQRNLILNSEINYGRHANICFEVIKVTGTIAVVKTWQEVNSINKYISQKELINRAKEVFKDTGYVVHVHATESILYGLEDFGVKDILANMEKYNLSQIDISRYTQFDKTSLNRILSGGRELTKIHKSMFFYFFKALEIKQ